MIDRTTYTLSYVYKEDESTDQDQNGGQCRGKMRGFMCLHQVEHAYVCSNAAIEIKSKPNKHYQGTTRG
eukprot:9510436-Alexandrium_andersonii.AAC.1